ncbi:hypothetical protein B0O99DRAFT_596081 [Bisporella sp. PMI_857]|nr:hypothetical protein B0O99DRAFT_596081 [Bisporella sp. PMI_857]
MDVKDLVPKKGTAKTLGPLDKRKKKTRCKACAQRRIKCQGGFPCQFCRQNKRLCVPPSPQNDSAIVFINQTDGSQLPYKPEQESQVISTLLSLPPKIKSDTVTQLTGHFFTGFLDTNDFTDNRIMSERISSLYQSSRSLYHALVSIAALDASKHATGWSTREVKAVELAAFNSYHISMVALSIDLKEDRLITNDACLWSTFLLSIFELMYDATGDGWVQHFLYGTSRVLQVRGPQNCRSGHGRSLFLSMRVFEICRSAIYVEPTFLADPEWLQLLSEIRYENPVIWHPKEALLDIMTSVVALSHKAHVLDRAGRVASQDALLSLVAVGNLLQADLYRWSSIVSCLDLGNPLIDSQILIARIYYHATSIFLSGIFDYRPCYSSLQVQTPSLSQSEIDVHVDGILGLASLALNSTYLSGVLFFYPLRVAGARVKNDNDKQSLLRMLERITSRNFVVAGAFVADLEKLWAS